MPFKIPEGDALVKFAQELTDQCMVSQKDRLTGGAYFKQYYYSGSDTGQPALYNRCYSHCDRLSSYLFSPSEVHFLMTFDQPEKRLLELGKIAARFLSYEFHRSGVDQVFSQGVDWSLVKGSSFVKTLWGHDGLEASVVQPECMGVLREDINELDRQEAFNHQIFLTKSQFMRLIDDHPDKKDIQEKLNASGSEKTEDKFDQSYLHQIIIGGINPLTNTSLANQNVGNMAGSVFGGPDPQLASDVKAELICINELWVQDRERDDYTTIQYVEPGIIIEGRLKRRNLSGVEGEQPFTQLCPNRTDGYFWGRSELTGLVFLQDTINRRMAERDRIAKLRARPPKFITGSAGLTEQEKLALNTPAGFVVSNSPNAKMDSVAPELPPEIQQDIEFLLTCFDDVGGFEAITKGQGESGVRSGVHAETLVRTATPRLRDRALSVERSAGDVGDFCFRLLQNKVARQFSTKEGESFLLDQLPEGFRISVDSHSSSPAFSQETKQTALELLKAGAIDAGDFIMLTHPPAEDILIEKSDERAKKAAEEEQMVLKEAQKDPSLLVKLFGGRGKKR
jgi:hypothetical protein